jgi:hypothetical protein
MAVSARGLGVLAGIFWLVLVLPLVLLAFLAVMVGSQSVILFAATAAGGLVVATALITKPTSRRRLVASVALGLVFAIIAVLAAQRSEGAFPSAQQDVAYGALAVITALISAIGALAATSRGAPSRR